MATRRIELKNSGVVFNEEAHTYHLNGKELSGITDMLSRQLFNGKEFEGIPKSVLDAAAQYGSDVHKSIEDFDVHWTNDGTVEVADYIQLCKDNGLVPIASEYNVTDGVAWSSNIDKVFRASNTSFHLADIKTFAVLDANRLLKARFQLSIYALLFEGQNPGAKVDKLYILRLRNKPKKDGTFDHISELIPVTRIPSEICKELLDSDLRGEQFKNPYAIPEDISAQEDEIRELIETKNAAEARLSEIKMYILSVMEAQDIKAWATDTGMRLTRKLPAQRSSFDFKAFKADHPEHDYSSYMRLSNVAGSLSITI